MLSRILDLHRPLATLLCGISLCGCASLPGAASPSTTNSHQADRQSILGMRGEYAVDFNFSETVLLTAGYERRPAKHSGAHETVILVEDSPSRIVLQHILVSETGGVIKHWRQDWSYEAADRLEFSEDQTWRLRPIAQDLRAGAWTQCVYEVSDAPRYCGTGRWEHRDGIATWTSDPTWRPLPRREYSVRKDYNALRAINRHTIVPGGWTHEQDNEKLRREGELPAGSLVREFGFNDYRHIDTFDFKPAYAYWNKTRDYWAIVRSEWQQRIQSGGGIQLKTSVDGMKIIAPLFEQAANVEKDGSVAKAEIDTVFDRWTAAPDAGNAKPAAAPRTAAQAD